MKHSPEMQRFKQYWYCLHKNTFKTLEEDIKGINKIVFMLLWTVTNPFL